MLVRGRTALLLLPIAAGVLIGAEPAKLAPDQMAKAARTDTITIPTPGELFAALQKPGKPNWTGAYRAPIPTTYKNRAQLALNLGGLIADGFIAVEAQDSQQVKNIGGDITKMAAQVPALFETLSGMPLGELLGKVRQIGDKSPKPLDK